jgi:hypothetical protein
VSIPLANVNPLTDSFENWLEKTNQVLSAISNEVVTASSNSVGGSTSGNVSISGTLSAQTFAVLNELRGGSVTTPNTLIVSSDLHAIGSNAYFPSNASFNNTNTNINSANLSISGGTLNVTSNVNIRSNTIHISTSGRLGVNTGNPDATLTVFGSANVSGRSNFLDDVNIFGSLAVSNSASFSNVTTSFVTTNRLTVQSTSNFNDSLFVGGSIFVDESSLFQNNVLVAANVTINNNLIVNNAVVGGEATFDSLVLTANALPVQSGGTGLKSFFPGVLVASNTTHIASIDGAPLDVLQYTNSGWDANVLPSMAYQNSTNVSITGGSISDVSISGATITGGSISSITSLSVSGNVTVTGNVAVSVNITAAGNITATGNITCNQLLPSTDLAVERGGTGQSTFSGGHLLVGNGTSPLNSVGPGAAGEFLRSTGTGWTTVALIASSTQIPIGGYTMGRVAGNNSGAIALYTTWNAASSPIQTGPNASSGSVNYGTWRIVGAMNDIDADSNGFSFSFSYYTYYLFQRIA